jgi:hypothetical protein
MIVFLINTCNVSKYEEKSRQLALNIRYSLKGSVCVIVKGGCEKERCDISDNLIQIDICDNLYTYNMFMGVKKFHETFEKYKSCLYICLQDSCVVSPYFKDKIESLRHINIDKYEWIFAHSYGLYSIGLCNLAYILRRAKYLEHVELTRQDARTLEQGDNIYINGKIIPSILSESKYTIGKMNCESGDYLNHEQIKNLDSYSINGISHEGHQKWVTYIGSLGIYKLYTSRKSFFLPIWCEKQHQPKKLNDWNILREIAFQNGTGIVPLISITE